jgi:hypothetical protein
MINQVDRDIIYARFGFGAPAEPWRTILRRDPCAYCGCRTGDIAVDHITPYAALPASAKAKTSASPCADGWHRQKSAGLSNGTPACHTCNEEKAAASLLGYLSRVLPSQFDVVVVRSARKRAARMLAGGLPRTWWMEVGRRIASGRTYRARDDRYRVPATASNGAPVTIVLAADLHRLRGHVYKITITGFGLED